VKRFLQYLRYVLILIGILIPMIAKCDVWSSPKINTYYSENREYKLIVTPTMIPDKYYQWSYYKSNKHPQTRRILRQKERFMRNISSQDTIRIPCSAELYRVTETDSIQIWKKTLLNDISPVHTIIANDGSSVATFDNWYGTGYGKNVFVVYNETGEAKKTYTLEEISPFPLNDYLRTVSSLFWYREVRFINNERIEILFATENVNVHMDLFYAFTIVSSGKHTESSIKRVYNVKSLEFEK